MLSVEKCDSNRSTAFSVWRKIRHEDRSVLDREVPSRIFSKVLICSRETEALGFDGEISVFSLLYKFSLLCRPPGLDGNKISDVEPIP